MENGEEVDYAAEGRALLRRVNLRLESAPKNYDNANPIFCHPETGAVLYVGNECLATSRADLEGLGITRIVFCQDEDGTMPFASDTSFRYLAFPIGRWRDGKRSLKGAIGWENGSFHGDPTQSSAMILAFFAPLFEFVDAELSGGNHVLIHCLAGAHRAGSAGIACLMHTCQLNFAAATAVAKAARPVIEPIGGFANLLSVLEKAQKTSSGVEIGDNDQEQQKK